MSGDWLLLSRKARFGDCDVAGVLHFHNLFRWAHESWEESIEKYGLKVNEVFPIDDQKSDIIFPIVNCEANFYSPIRIGDLLNIKLFPSQINNHLFKVQTFFLFGKLKVAESKFIHCSLNKIQKEKVAIPKNLMDWINSSEIKNN